MVGSSAPMMDRAPLGARPPHTRWEPREVAAATVLIVLGVVFLALNAFAFTGGMVLLVLALVCAVARATTGRYGFAVAAGLLLGVGLYSALDDAGRLPGDNSVWFFCFAALGFAAIYVVGWRLTAIWPLFPAVGLLAIGAMLAGSTQMGFLSQLVWVARYWPLMLILLGGWLLVRDRVPAELRRPGSLLVWLVVDAYIILAIGAAIAVTQPLTRDFGLSGEGVSLGWLGSSTSWWAPYNETTNFAAPLTANDTLRVDVPSGRITVRSAAVPEMRLTATKHYSNRDQAPDVQVTQGPGVVNVTATEPTPNSSIFSGVQAASVDVDLQVPSGARLELRTGSGSIDLSHVAGMATVSTGSGSVRVTDASGEVRATTGSGSIRVTDAPLLREATSGSGSIRLSGKFTGDARVQTGSGGVTASLAPSSAVRISASTDFGNVRVNGLQLANQRGDRHSVSGTLGSGSGTLAIHTSSGDITLKSAS